MSLLLVAAALAADTAVQAPPSPPSVSVAAADKPVDPAAVAAATKLLGVLHTDRMVDAMIGTLMPMATTAVLGLIEQSPDTRVAVQQIESKPNGRARLMVIFSEEMLKAFRARYPDIMAASAREYAKLFTAAELNQLVGFFSSGTGAKWVEASPQLQQAVGAAGAQIGREAGRQAGARAMERAVRELLPPGKTSS